MPSVPSETIGALAVSESSLDSGTDGTGTGNSHSMTDSVRCDLLADCTAEWLSSMEALRKDLVRSVPAHCALHCFGAALRGQMGQSASKMSLYGMSKETDIIDEFWSHSWHSEPWKKVLCLLFLKNGVAAAVAGTVACLVGCALTIDGSLPNGVPFEGISLWGTALGIFSYLLTLLLWRPWKSVFLDIGCINQEDASAKTQGILSMGGILKQSRTMLVLWDVTWVQRLWCIFEFAAFLKSRGSTMAKTPLIRPILFGACALTIFGFTCMVMFVMIFLFSLGFRAALLPSVGAIFFFILYPAAVTFRDYFWSMDTLAEQLRNFCISNSKCHCCSTGHPDRSVPCDREIVLRCIRRWFGSEKTFEDTVRALLPSLFAEQLGRFGFPYWLLLVATCPMLWSLLDLTVSHWLRGDHFWQFWLGATGGWWLGAHPFAAGLFFYGAKVLRAPARSRLRDVLKNLCVIALNLPVLVLTFGLNEILIIFQMPTYLTAIIAGSIHISLAVTLWFSPFGLRHRSSGTFEQEAPAVATDGMDESAGI